MASQSSWRQQRPRQHHSARVKSQPFQQLSNLQSFFVHSAPVVPIQSGDEAVCSSSYFSLQDLWSSFDEWSAYGAEIPMRVHVNGAWQDIIQCYVPYLSGLQLFGADHARRIRSYSSDDEAVSNLNSSCCDSSSNSTCTSSGASTASVDSDCEVDSKDSPVCSDAGQGKAGVFASSQRSVLQKQQSLGEPGKSLFEVFESESPYSRSTLSDRIAELSEKFPALLSLSSRELHPASWFAVAWYPIYRIPALADPVLSRELQASLLTFHSLSVTPTLPTDMYSPLEFQVCPPPPYAPAAAALAWRSETARQQLLSSALSALSDRAGTRSTNSEADVGSALPKAVNVACLRPFAFMPYKVMGQTWVDDYNLRSQHLPMISTAGHWLDRRKVRLPDFDFFSKNFRPLPIAARR